MYDGAPAHFGYAVRDVLNNAYHDRWIGTERPIEWPPRSPDLNPLVFYVLGYLSTLVYAGPVDKKEEFYYPIVDVPDTC
jgi:hypothetical protein